MGTGKGKSPKSKAASKSSVPSVPGGSSRKTVMKPANPAPSPRVHLPGDMWERIARKAYQLYEQRGRIEGRDLQDWYDAESLVMQEIHSDRK
jgi:hypothetical protein